MLGGNNAWQPRVLNDSYARHLLPFARDVPSAGRFHAHTHPPTHTPTHTLSKPNQAAVINYTHRGSPPSHRPFALSKIEPQDGVMTRAIDTRSHVIGHRTRCRPLLEQRHHCRSPGAPPDTRQTSSASPGCFSR